MKIRLDYYGGSQQNARLQKDKLRSLKAALYNSYQAATAILPDKKEFKCLINSNKISMDADDKILSIPFRDVDLIDGIEQDTNIQEGDVIEWKENRTHWLVYLQRLEETAYFRADLRRCKYQITLENGSQYWIYVKGPSEKKIAWSQGGGNFVNQLNNSLVIYISKTEETLDYFKRFNKVYINNKPWEVQVVDDISATGIIEVALKETHMNTAEDNLALAVEKSKNIIQFDTNTNQEEQHIAGLNKVYPYETYSYTLNNYSGKGSWIIKNTSRDNMIKIISNTDYTIDLEIITGRSGNFTLAYMDEDREISKLDISIESL